MSNGMILTDAGREMLTLALGGQELHFTRGAVGDGNAPASPNELTALVNECRSLPIQSIRTSTTGTCEIVLTITNENQATGFWLREYGLFAEHPTSHTEMLYAYCNKGNEAGYLEGFDGANPISFALTLVTIVDQAPDITAEISTENTYVTVTRLEGRIQSLFADSNDIAGVWTYGAETQGRLSPISWNNFKLRLLGITDITSLNSRVERVEDNLSEALLMMELHNMYPGYSHIMIEDFNDNSQVDTFACSITSIVAGDDSIDCEVIDGILPGSWYTVTDGINAEDVQIHSVNLENGIQRIILEDVITNTYNLETCRLLRTTAGVSQEGAIGNGLRQVLTWRPELEWSGVEADTIQTSRLDFSAGNAKSYTMSGSLTITNTGGITLTA